MMQCWRCNAKRRVNQAKDASKRCELKQKNAQGKLKLKTRCRRWKHLRLSAGLGAAGLASGFAASHFEGVWLGWVI